MFYSTISLLLYIHNAQTTLIILITPYITSFMNTDSDTPSLLPASCNYSSIEIRKTYYYLIPNVPSYWCYVEPKGGSYAKGKHLKFKEEPNGYCELGLQMFEKGFLLKPGRFDTEPRTSCVTGRCSI